MIHEVHTTATTITWLGKGIDLMLGNAGPSVYILLVPGYNRPEAAGRIKSPSKEDYSHPARILGSQDAVHRIPLSAATGIYEVRTYGYKAQVNKSVIAYDRNSHIRGGRTATYIFT